MLSRIKQFLFSAEYDIADLNEQFLIAHKKSVGVFHRDLESFLAKLGINRRSAESRLK